MTKERKKEIRMYCDAHEDLPDGAFFALMMEFGIGPEEVADAYGEEEKEDGNETP